MILELTPNRKPSRQSIEQFAREVVAPRAAAIDESGEFPARRDPRRGGARPARRDDPEGVGRRRARLRQLRARDRGDRAGERDGRGVARRCTNSLVAELIAHAGTRRAERAWLRRAGDRRGDRRLRAVGARRRAPTPRISRRRAVRAGDGYRITGRKVWVANAEAAARGDRLRVHAARAARPGRHRVSRADGHAGHHAHGARRLARRARPRLHGSRSRRRRSATIRCSAASIRDFALAMWALQGGRVAIAAQALGIGEAALDEAIAYAKQREQFGQPIAQLPGDPVDARRHGDRARRGADAD